jgi:hypothetical protein
MHRVTQGATSAPCSAPVAVEAKADSSSARIGRMQVVRLLGWPGPSPDSLQQLHGNGVARLLADGL